MGISGGRLLGWSLALSIGFGPIYWLPGVPNVAILGVKVAALLTFIGSVLWGNAPQFAGKYVAPLLVLIWAGTMSSIYHEDAFVVNAVVLSLIVIIAGIVTIADHQIVVWKYVERGVKIFTIFALLVILDAVRGGVIPNPYYDYFNPLYLTGFHGGRTGWGVTCGFMLAFALTSALNTKSRTHVLWLIIAVIMAANTILVGTRGGVVTSALLLAGYAAINVRSGSRISGKGIAAIAGLVLMLAGLVVVYWEGIQRSRVWTSFTGGSALEEESRLFGYELAINGIAEHPLAGYGEFSLDVALGYSEIHNLWLRLLVERGLIVGSISAAVLLWLILPLWRTPVRGAALVLLAGLAPTMIEPTAIFGNFFSTFGFWFVVIYLTHNTALTLKASHNVPPAFDGLEVPSRRPNNGIGARGIE